MDLTPLHLVGGRELSGEIAIQHSKNAALPIIVASLLSREPVTLHGIPRLSDVDTILELMAHLGRVRSTSTSRRCGRWGHTSRKRAATSRRRGPEAWAAPSSSRC